MHNVLTKTETAKEIICREPATGNEIARVTLTSPDAVRAAVDRARIAQHAWSGLSFKERGRVILRARELVLAQSDDIALLISRETGKPVAEAMSMEIVPTLDLMYYFANHSARLLKPQKIDIGQYGFMGRSSKVIYGAIGVVAIISPWNFPWATPLDEVVMALMAGNAVVLKPSELAPLSALKIAAVFKEAGLPDSVLQVLTGDGSTGAALVDSGVDKIMFTGSVATGKRVAEAAARHLTPVVLELGGKDPMLVLRDSNVENAARAAVWGAFANSGQACASIERCYVDQSIANQFIASVVAKTEMLNQRSPMESDTDVGAMSNERQLLLVEEHVADAVRAGARVLCGGSRGKGPGWFYQPTVLTNVNHSMKIMCEETFGPVLPIMTFRSEAEALELANDSIYGLTASIWTNDLNRGRRLAEKIAAGTVMVNEVVYTHAIAQTPWGGVKQSGYGRTHGRLGLLELVTPHHIHVNRFPFIPDVWWFRYNPAAARLFRGLAKFFTTGSILKSARLLPQIIRRLRDRN